MKALPAPYSTLPARLDAYLLAVRGVEDAAAEAGPAYDAALWRLEVALSHIGDDTDTLSDVEREDAA